MDFFYLNFFVRFLLLRNMGSYFETVPKMDEISQEEAKAVGVKSNID